METPRAHASTSAASRRRARSCTSSAPPTSSASHPIAEAFDWGADAQGAAVELARVLLTDASGSEPPENVCRRFAEQILSKLPRDGFALQRETVDAWLRRAVAADRP